VEKEIILESYFQINVNIAIISFQKNKKECCHTKYFLLVFGCTFFIITIINPTFLSTI